MLFFTSFLLVTSAFGVSLGDDYICKDGWAGFGESCYLVGDVKKTFEDARSECSNKGGLLTEIGDKNEDKFIRGLLEKQGSADGAWIGGENILFMWIWVDSMGDLDYSNWNKDDAGAGSCLSMSKASGWTWMAHECSDSALTFVCETPAICQITQKCSATSCYNLLCAEIDYEDAQAECKKIDRKIVEIDTPEENKFVQSFLVEANFTSRYADGVWVDKKNDKAADEQCTFLRKDHAWLRGRNDPPWGDEIYKKKPTYCSFEGNVLCEKEK